ncbi:MAG: lecithin retinol acyltransferase family protein [Chitinophagaceae bacterium]|nr:lecithin retinol acyltransferase family protein [Chitinophagaceae bacterium]
MNYVTNLIQTNKLKPADVIVLKKTLFGMLDHYAIFLGYDEFGHPFFVANYTKGINRISYVELKSFLQIMEPQRIVRFNGTNSQRNAAVQRAISRLGERNYNYFENNCEHYANYVQHGVHYSSQSDAFKDSIKTVVPLALGVAFLAAIFGKE